MPLVEYKRKRDFKATPEPGPTMEHTNSHRFVIQRHDASRLHYDFRLEMDGVLKSWAVPKGPSMNPGDKRLAVMVEDHPVSYIGFYGSIPEGNYGAGTVDIWDQGTYVPIDPKGKEVSQKAANAALKAGNLKFRLKGKNINGEFALVRLKNDEKNWLLIKHRDEFATDKEYTSEKVKPIKLHKTGGVWGSNKKTKESGEKKTDTTKKSKPAAKPASKKKPSEEEEVVNEVKKFTRFNPGRKLEKFITPMLASLGEEPFDNADWIFELKWDGYRAIAECSKKDLKLYSRNGLSFNERFPPVVEALEELKINAVLDGEIVLFNENDQPDFQKLQHYAENQNFPLIYYVFDILSLDNKDLRQLPLLERKAVLKELLKDNDVIRYSDHIEENGIAFFEQVRKKNLEGIMAKRSDSEYVTGIRTREWLKIKNTQAKEAIIAGYTEGKGSRKHFGALVLGEYRDGKLHYIGHTGTGFSDEKLKELWALMQKFKSDSSPFEVKIPVNGVATWLKPKLVCEIKYSEVTRDGILRHPVFLRIRDDKPAKEVKPEPMVKTVKAAKKAAAPKTAKPSGAKKKNIESENNKVEIVNKRKIELSNLNKVYWPDEGFTKGDVIRYYDSIADYILPYLKDRPLSLKRNPNGLLDDGFYQKNAAEIALPWMKTAPILSESNNKTIHYLVCNDKATLLFIANLGCIEMNPWNSTTKSLDKPTWLVIDIDPSDDNTFDEVIETAQVVKGILERGGAECYCKTSGASGLHVYIPLGAKYTYDQVKDFANLIAMMVVEELPDTTTLERSLSKRSKRKIYVDYLQNRRGQTLATTYSLRPKPGATVSTPLDWKEVKPGLSPSDFNFQNILQRVKKKGDLFLPVLSKGIDLRKVLGKLGK